MRIHNMARRGKLGLAGTVIAMGAMAGVAWADFLQADTDVVLSGIKNSEVKLDAQPGQVLTFPVDLYVGCSQKAHMGASVTASYDAVNSTVHEGGALDATSATISRPAGWPADGNECPKGSSSFTNPVRSTVTVTAPSTTGVKDYVVRWKTNDADVQAGINGGQPSNITIKLNVKAPPPPTAPADTTPPVITKVVSGTLGTNGWYTSTATVTWSVSDPESAITSTSGCGVESFTQSVSSATSSCSATSAGGTTNDSVTLKVDKDAPAVNPADVDNATWRNSALSQAFTASDAHSGLANSADASFTLTASNESTKDPAGFIPTSVSRIVSDAAGNSTTRSLSALIDLTAPSITDNGVSAGTLGANGWYTSAVSNTFSPSDALSGLAAGFTSPFTKSSGNAEGSAVKISSGPVDDIAGNRNAGIDSAPFKIDLSDPLHGVTDNNAATYNVCGSSRPVKPGFAPSDAVSGLDSANTSESWTPSSNASGVGSYTYSAKATDMAGRASSYGPKTYTVSYGDGTGGGAYSGIQQPINADGTSRFKLGSTVPVKFKLLCGTTPISNAVASLTVARADTTPDPGLDEAISTAASTTGNLFRYDATNQQYIFNLSTKSGYTNPDGSTITSYSVGTWRISVKLDDGTHRTHVLQIVK